MDNGIPTNSIKYLNLTRPRMKLISFDGLVGDHPTYTEKAGQNILTSNLLFINKYINSTTGQVIQYSNIYRNLFIQYMMTIVLEYAIVYSYEWFWKMVADSNQYSYL